MHPATLWLHGRDCFRSSVGRTAQCWSCGPRLTALTVTSRQGPRARSLRMCSDPGLAGARPLTRRPSSTRRKRPARHLTRGPTCPRIPRSRAAPQTPDMVGKDTETPPALRYRHSGWMTLRSCQLPGGGDGAGGRAPSQRSLGPCTTRFCARARQGQWRPERSSYLELMKGPHAILPVTCPGETARVTRRLRNNSNLVSS